jgi:hypothetical protein
MARGAIRLAVGCLAVVGLSAPASAFERVLSDQALAAAIDVYVDGVVAAHAIELACTGSADGARWAEGGRALVATLWANGLPVASVHDVERRLTAPSATGGAAPDCNDPDITAKMKYIGGTGWPALHRLMEDGVGLAPVATPPTDGQFAAVKAAFAREVPAEARMLACIAVTDGSVFPFALSDWMTTLLATAKAMVAAGLPRDEVGALLDSADPLKLWRKASAAEADDLRKACRSDQTWSNRFYMMETGRLRFDIEKVLKSAP